MTNTRPNPYPGPRSFQRGETLYGRQRETWEVLNLLIAERIVLLVAPSGAGKTSLVQAALAPELEKEGFRVLPIMRPSLLPHEPAAQANRYVLSLLLALEASKSEAEQRPLAELAGLSLSAYLDAAWAVPEGDGWHGDVLLFDQFEEILTADPSDRTAKHDFFAQVGAVLRDRNRWALFSMREEFVAALDSYLGPIPARFDKGRRYRLDLLGPDAARKAMQGPPADQDPPVAFTDAAAHRLADDLRRVQVQAPDGTLETAKGTYVEPVQLQVVCRQLWEKLADDDLTIDVDDLHAVGDVDAALRAFYAETVAAVAAEEQVSERAIRAWIDTQLITESGFRGQVLMGAETSQGLANAAIWPLVDAHLLRAEQRRGATWFELAHDRLITPVRRDNSAWTAANLSMLQQQAALWEQQKRPDGLLLRDAALEQAEQWAQTHATDMLPVEDDFLKACRAARQRYERELRQRDRIRMLAVAAAVVAVLAVILAGFAWQQTRTAEAAKVQAEEQSRRAQAGELAAYAQNAIENDKNDPSLALLLATRAIEVTWRATEHIVTENADAALRDAIDAAPPYVMTLPRHRHTGIVTSAAYSPDGAQIVTASSDQTARIWDAATGQEVRQLSGHTDWVNSAAWSPDGTQIVTASNDKTARVWDAGTGRELLQLTGHTDSVRSAAYSPDGTQIVTASEDGTARIWDAATGEEVRQLSGHTDAVNSAAWSPDGTQIVTASGDGTARIWDRATGQEVRQLSGHTDSVRSAAWSLDGTQIVTASGDGTARIWDAATGQEVRILSGHTDYVWSVTWSPDGRQIVTASGSLFGDNRTARIWDAETGQEVRQLSGHTGPVNSAAYSPDGTQIVTASADDTARIWDLAMAKEVRQLSGHTDFIGAAAYSPDGTQVVTASDDGTARIWDAATGEEVRQLSGHSGSVYSAAYSPDGMHIVTASRGQTARIWDAATGEEVRQLRGHIGEVSSAAYSPDGTQIVTASGLFGDDRTARIWDAETGQELRQLSGHTDAVNSAAWSPDGRQIVTASFDQTARIWDAATGQELRQLGGHTGSVNSAAWSPDGKQIVTASWDQTARIWDAVTGRVVRQLSGHTDGIYSAVWSPDGTQIVTASDDGTARIWNAATGRVVRQLSGHTDAVNSAAWSPDGTQIVTASRDQTARIWIANIDDLLAEAERLIQRDPPLLTPEERRRYGLE